jgi:DNA polymerase sigma
MISVQDLYKQKRSLELDWEKHYIQEGKYTLDMVRIDEKIREIINQIKMSEAEIATRQIMVENAAPEFSVAS